MCAVRLECHKIFSFLVYRRTGNFLRLPHAEIPDPFPVNFFCFAALERSAKTTLHGTKVQVSRIEGFWSPSKTEVRL